MIKPHHRLALALAALYFVAMASILLWPTPVDAPVDVTLDQVLRWAHFRGLPNGIGYNQVEFTANIVLFVPMGYLASVRWRNGWVGLVTGCLISCLVELSQTLFLPHRFGSGMDVLANTLGAAIGAAIYFMFRRRLSRVGAPVAEPVDIPVAEPVEIPVAEPVEIPVAEPVETKTAHRGWSTHIDACRPLEGRRDHAMATVRFPMVRASSPLPQS